MLIQSELISENELLIQFVESISQMVVILNEHRQIVYANERYKQFCNVADRNTLLGQRPGETMGCANAFKTATGCGTSDFCKSCGAVNAILESQKGEKSTKECKILTADNQAFEFKVTATPIYLEAQNLTIFSITDISAEKRKESLERIFLHDILNSAGGISGLSSILKEINEPAEMTEIAETIANAANNLVEEIKVQRELSSAECGELKPDLKYINSIIILQDLKNIYLNHERNDGKTIVIHKNAEDVVLETDTVLLKRVLGNMIKNAIEANIPEDEITLNSIATDQMVRFSVHNKSIISQNVQSELFKRTFSTKGIGRGLGTYSMKLFGEKYLNGKVWFESSVNKGTIFFIELQKEI